MKQQDPKDTGLLYCPIKWKQWGESWAYLQGNRKYQSQSGGLSDEFLKIEFYILC